jgi:molybdopterin-guanine dinucleotide biosynthesis protein
MEFCDSNHGGKTTLIVSINSKTRDKRIQEIAMRIAYALPYHYCEDDHEALGWIAEDEEDVVRAAMSVADLLDKPPPMP